RIRGSGLQHNRITHLNFPNDGRQLGKAWNHAVGLRSNRTTPPNSPNDGGQLGKPWNHALSGLISDGRYTRAGIQILIKVGGRVAPQKPITRWGRAVGQVLAPGHHGEDYQGVSWARGILLH